MKKDIDGELEGTMLKRIMDGRNGWAMLGYYAEINRYVADHCSEYCGLKPSCCKDSCCIEPSDNDVFAPKPCRFMLDVVECIRRFERNKRKHHGRT